ncbi:sensor histidine kinase [Thermoflexus sp.]|uniref:sensor histidine kinase n=1 Tax=Thermoflexus sp. TaxID=1969742 RepID=UPI0035E416DD
MRRYLAVGLASGPALLGLGLSVLLAREVVPNLVLVGTFQADLAALAAGTGVLLSLGGWGVLGLRAWVQRERARVRAAERERHATAHRRFLRRLDHELKNPLAIIHLGVANLQDRLVSSSEEADSLARVAEQVRRLETLVAELRRLAELEELALEGERVDLQVVLEEAIALACETEGATARQVDVHVQHVPWPVAPVWGDRDLLVVAFRNLLDNALKFTRAGDPVEVRVREEERWAVVEVADGGPGIPAEELPHIFEELYRGSNARDIPGSGLGLALVQRIVALHGGEIQVRSREGQGTVVTVRLPLAAGEREVFQD